DEDVRIFVAGPAVPQKHVGEMKRRGVEIMGVTGKIQHAVRAEAGGAGGVGGQRQGTGGPTAGSGARGPLPQGVRPAHNPARVVAAGGITDGRGVVAALALGAQGAVIGTRFIATPEATAARQYREALVAAKQDETVRTRCYSGKPLRSLRNHYIAEYEADPTK